MMSTVCELEAMGIFSQSKFREFSQLDRKWWIFPSFFGTVYQRVFPTKWMVEAMVIFRVEIVDEWIFPARKLWIFPYSYVKLPYDSMMYPMVMSTVCELEAMAIFSQSKFREFSQLDSMVDLSIVFWDCLPEGIPNKLDGSSHGDFPSRNSG